MNGYVYVLVNPAMPGLAKVGMTTRQPSERLSELSGATGVPTPFVLLYEQPVTDCRRAEAWVHCELERMGARTAKNREFFNAPIHEIVKVVFLSAEATKGQQERGEHQQAEDDVPAWIESEASLSAQIAEDFFQVGLQAEGSDAHDTRTAVWNFGEAARLGHLGAILRSIKYANAELRFPDVVNLAEEALGQGHWQSELDLAKGLLRLGRKREAYEHMASFIERAWREELSSEQSATESGQLIKVALEYLEACARHSVKWSLNGDCARYLAPRLLSELEAQIGLHEQRGDNIENSRERDRLMSIGRYFEERLAEK